MIVRLELQKNGVITTPTIIVTGELINLSVFFSEQRKKKTKRVCPHSLDTIIWLIWYSQDSVLLFILIDILDISSLHRLAPIAFCEHNMRVQFFSPPGLYPGFYAGSVCIRICLLSIYELLSIFFYLILTIRKMHIPNCSFWIYVADLGINSKLDHLDLNGQPHSCSVKLDWFRNPLQCSSWE